MGYINKSLTDNYGTPDYIIENIKKKHVLSLFDPCPLNDNPLFNGLLIDYPRDNIIFINPPYSQLKSTKKKGIGWVEKAYNECLKGSKIIMLLPSRTDTSWFHTYIYNKYKIEFLKGRIKFKGSNYSAPFPSMLVYFMEYDEI